MLTLSSRSLSFSPLLSSHFLSSRFIYHPHSYSCSCCCVAHSFYLFFSLSSLLINVSFYCPLLLSGSTSVFFRAFLFLFLPSLSCASLSRSFHPFCSASGPFVYPFPFQPVFVRLLAHSLLSFVLVASSSPSVVLFFHLFLFTPSSVPLSPAPGRPQRGHPRYF